MALIQDRSNISEESDYTLQINIQSNIKPPVILIEQAIQPKYLV